MATRFVSFGFKYGAPVDADLLLDVRFLDNPYFVPDISHLPGTDPAIISFVLDRDETRGSNFCSLCNGNRVVKIDDLI